MTVCGCIRLRVLACVALALGVTPLAPFCDAKAAESHALAMHGAPALPPDFTHMPYANPDAPKGGRLVWGIRGTFDSLNPLIVRGIAVQQMRGFVVESLMARGSDEAFTARGRSRDIRGNDNDRADRFGPLSRHCGQAGGQRHADPQSRLLGPRPAGQSWLVELRRDQARLLSRIQRPVRGVQARPLRLSCRARTTALARRL